MGRASANFKIDFLEARSYAYAKVTVSLLLEGLTLLDLPSLRGLSLDPLHLAIPTKTSAPPAGIRSWILKFTFKSPRLIEKPFSNSKPERSDL